MVSFTCPNCKTLCSHPDSGVKVYCPKCGQKLLVPAPQNKTVLGDWQPATSAPAAPVTTAPPPDPVPRPRPAAALPGGGYRHGPSGLGIVAVIAATVAATVTAAALLLLFCCGGLFVFGPAPQPEPNWGGRLPEGATLRTYPPDFPEGAGGATLRSMPLPSPGGAENARPQENP